MAPELCSDSKTRARQTFDALGPNLHPSDDLAPVCRALLVCCMVSSRFAPLVAARRARFTRANLLDLARRLAHFWVVWSALLLVHEVGHAIGAWREGLAVRRVTAGVGPVLWRTHRGDTEIVLRLVPVAGITTFARPNGAATEGPARGNHDTWRHELTTIAGGVLATLAFAMLVAGGVAVRERVTRTRWRWGRYVVADAVVLTLFNFLPVPPLDGGRAVIGALTAWGGIHLTPDALLWVQLGGLALAIVPMALWTRWTERIDAAALRWGAPRTRLYRHP